MKKDSLKKHIVNYEINKNYFPDDVKQVFEQFFEFAGFHIGVVEEMKEECCTQLKTLAYKHYPSFAGITEPVLLTEINELNETVLYGIAYAMKALVAEMNSNTDIKTKYPKLEEWREFYVHPKPDVTSENDRNNYNDLSDEEWKEFIEKENREMRRFFYWEEQRKKEFYDCVQPVLFKLYPVLYNLEGDYWVLYAVNMRDEYENWKTLMEEIETIIDYEMPPESIKWDYKEFRKEVSARFDKYHKSSFEKRIALINSFKLPEEK